MTYKYRPLGLASKLGVLLVLLGIGAGNNKSLALEAYIDLSESPVEFRETYTFPGFSPGQEVTIGVNDVWYQKNVRANSCGILSVTVPSKLNFYKAGRENIATVAGLHHPNSYGEYVWTSPMVSVEPKCNGADYNGPKYQAPPELGYMGITHWYLWSDNKGKIKVWSNIIPRNELVNFQLRSDTDPFKTTVTRKADSCGIVKFIARFHNLYVPGGMSSSGIYSPDKDNSGTMMYNWHDLAPYVINGQTFDPSTAIGWDVQTGGVKAFCKNGLLYKPD